MNQGTFINNEFNDIYIIKKDILVFEIKMQKSEVQDLKYIHWTDLEKMVDEVYEKLVPHQEEYKLLFKYLKNHFSLLANNLYFS